MNLCETCFFKQENKIVFQFNLIYSHDQTNPIFELGILSSKDSKVMDGSITKNKDDEREENGFLASASLFVP